jgi:hypothetical protein
MDEVTERHVSSNRVFWAQVWSALQRLFALAIFLAAHAALNRALAYTAPPDQIGALAFVQSALFVFFLMIYVYLTWEMVSVFVPRVKRSSVDLREQNESRAEMTKTGGRQ